VRERVWPHVRVMLDLHAGINVARFAQRDLPTPQIAGAA
jgi:hypothetical protein